MLGQGCSFAHTQGLLWCGMEQGVGCKLRSVLLVPPHLNTEFKEYAFQMQVNYQVVMKVYSSRLGDGAYSFQLAGLVTFQSIDTQCVVCTPSFGSVPQACKQHG